MKSRSDLPNYADWKSITLTQQQFLAISKGRRYKPLDECSTVRIAQTKDGKYWGEWKGSMVFWARRWYEIPKSVGERARKIEEFICHIM